MDLPDSLPRSVTIASLFASMRRSLVLALAGLAIVACGTAGDEGGHGPPPAVVGVVTVSEQALEGVVDLVGQLDADESVDLRAELPGVISGIEFQEGDEVKRGDVLFRLKDDEQVARVHEAEANVALAEETHARTKTLAGRNVMAAAQLDKARAELAAARARLELARVALDRTTIRAPFDGRMGARRVSPGDRVDTREMLATIHAVARLQLVFTVPEIGVPLARTGALVSIRVAAFPDESFAGEVFFVSPALDPRTRRLSLKAWVPNPDRRLRPGMFANIRFQTGTPSQAIVVPEEAVAYDSSGSFVWRVGEDRRAERVSVELGARRDGLVEVRSGVRPGDRIVSGGTHKVVAGGEVVPAEPSPTPASTAAPDAGAAAPAHRDGA